MADFPDRAYVESFHFDGEGKGVLKAKAFSMSGRVDDKGYFVVEKLRNSVTA